MDYLPKCKYKPIKLLEDKRENLNCLGYENTILDTAPKAQSMNGIIDNSDFIATKNSSVKDSMKRNRRQVSEWEKIYEDASDKGFLPEI